MPTAKCYGHFPVGVIMVHNTLEGDIMMRARSRITAVGAAIAVIIGTVGPTPAYAATEGTTANALTAMHDEAFAFASYMSWSDHAVGTGDTALAGLLMATASQERGEHFSELADMFNLVLSNNTNTRTAMFAEADEATVLYPGFAAQATTAGDTVAAALFTELAGDEGVHKAILVRAYGALTMGGRHPTPPVVTPVPIVEGLALSSGTTLANIGAALRGEAFASARYQLFGQMAHANGRAWLANLFFALANYELLDHFAVLANHYGLVSTDAVNLASAITAENGAIASYTTFAGEATTAGDTAAASLFMDIGGDEVLHQAAFTAQVGG
jgi:rubrerythrin